MQLAARGTSYPAGTACFLERLTPRRAPSALISPKAAHLLGINCQAFARRLVRTDYRWKYMRCRRYQFWCDAIDHIGPGNKCPASWASLRR